MSLRRLLLAGAAVVGFAAAAAPARAGTLTISDTTNRQGNGGEFKVSGFDNYYVPPAAVVTQVDGGNFDTFCIEYNESISLPGTYDYTIDFAGAINGGVSGGNPDPIGAATAKLFYTFWTNQWNVSTSGAAAASLTDVTYSYANGAQRGVDGADLQMAIWFLEGERTQSDINTWVTGHSGSQAQKFIDFATDADLTWALLGAGGWADSTAGGVAALNLTSGGSPRQSQLVVVPLPAGALMGFALLAALGLGWTIRSRRRHGLV